MTNIHREPITEDFKGLDTSSDAEAWPYCVVLEKTLNIDISHINFDPEQVLRDTGHSIHQHLALMGLRALTRGQAHCDWPYVTVTWHVRFAGAADSALFSFVDPPSGLKLV